MERREFLKLTLGFTAAAGAIVATAAAAQAAPMLPPTAPVTPTKGETPPPDKARVEPAPQDELQAGESSDTDMSSRWRRRRRFWIRRRRVYFVRRRRRFWRRRRVIYY